jgi:hypothetical protein
MSGITTVVVESDRLRSELLKSARAESPSCGDDGRHESRNPDNGDALCEVGAGERRAEIVRGESEDLGDIRQQLLSSSETAKAARRPRARRMSS